MKALLFGATGMVGTGVLLECLADERVTAVTAIGRSPSGRTHPKLTDLPHQDFLHLESLQPQLAGFAACFFCLGVSSLGLDEAAYTRITYDYTLAAARACWPPIPPAPSATSPEPEPTRPSGAARCGHESKAVPKMTFSPSASTGPTCSAPASSSRSRACGRRPGGIRPSIPS